MLEFARVTSRAMAAHIVETCTSRTGIIHAATTHSTLVTPPATLTVRDLHGDRPPIDLPSRKSINTLVCVSGRLHGDEGEPLGFSSEAIDSDASLNNLAILATKILQILL